MNDELGVVVAVGPDGLGEGAISFAAAEAGRRGTGIELLHVAHSVANVPANPNRIPLFDAGLMRVGHEMLTDAASRMRHAVAAGVPVSTEIVFGPVAKTIAERVLHADVVILERRDAGAVERFFTMSVSTAVAAHTHTPVVVVPRHWTADASAPLPVAVGVDWPSEALGQVQTALEYAHVAGRDLVVLHAAWLDTPYQASLLVTYPSRRWVAEAEQELTRSLAKLMDHEVAHGVSIAEKVVWARPVEALVEATKHSAVVVMSRRHVEHVGAHLGPITRAVLRHAEGPVMVVDRT